jgi:hypothetical protein
MEAATPTPAGPRLVRRVVCAYRPGILPGAWLQAWRRLDRALSRARLDVKATLAPLDDLPDDTDLLVVPPELRDGAAAVAGAGMAVVVAPPAAAADVFRDLVARLAAGTELTAERVDPAAQERPRVVTYRGPTRLD